MRSWRRATTRIERDLAEAAVGRADPVSLDTLQGLPHPVARYLRTVLRDGQPRVRTARVRQTGEFRARESADTAAGWRPFEAKQLFSVEPPGFVWDASIRMAPYASMRVRDAYVAGHASMLGALLGLVPVVNAADDQALRAGALQRFLAESVWFPTALLPSERLRWSPMDDAHARATLVDGETTVTLEFEFAPSGEILACATPERPRAVQGGSGRYERLPWGGRYSRWERSGGMLIPHLAEVFWVVGGREQPYYRGTNVSIDYVF